MAKNPGFLNQYPKLGLCAVLKTQQFTLTRDPPAAARGAPAAAGWLPMTCSEKRRSPPPLKKWTLDLSFGLDRGLNCSTNPHIILSVRMLESKNLLTRVAPGGFNHRSRGAAVCVTGSPAAAVALHRTCSERKIDLKHLHLWHWRSKVLHPPPKNMHTCWP